MKLQYNNLKQARLKSLVRKIISTVVLFSVILFIFRSSTESTVASYDKSLLTTEFFNSMIVKLGFEFQLTGHVVRKLAHFVEYCSLGFCLMLSLRAYTKRTVAFAAWPLLFGLLIAVYDEFFQTHTPGRTGQISDILLDFNSILLGVVISQIFMLLAKWLWELINRKHIIT